MHGLLIAIAAFAVVRGYESLATPSAAQAPAKSERERERLSPGPPRERRGGLGAGDGVVPEGTTAFDSGTPGVSNLDPALLGALRRAAADAARDGVMVLIESGWRSPAYQGQLLSEAIAEYGSRGEAARWVASPGTSPHVSGDAVDVGPDEAIAWLSTHGSAYGLCQIYGNEPWHFELRGEASSVGCPAMYPDPTHDPRMRG